jgi:FixJ family two-component response regulator
MVQNATASSEIHIVDDDAAVRDALAVVLTLEGYHVSGFADGHSFLAAVRSQAPACVILDVHMPGRSGLDILKELNAKNYPAPVFIISGQGDIPMAVEAIKNGAIEATARQQSRGGLGDSLAQFPGSDLLTSREREVLNLIAGGASNKEAGRQLGISPRTIEVHRARIMEKLGAKNAADLVRIVLSETRGM